MNDHTDTTTLLDFLNSPLNRTQEIFDLFSGLPGARHFGDGRQRVIYIEGSRPSASGRCLLVAHADTVWDESWLADGYDVDLSGDDCACLEVVEGVIRSTAEDRGIGADDRAGLAILWLLKDLGHSLLITDLEEHGRMGSSQLRRNHPETLNHIHRDHAFAIQFDRRNARDFKCYDVGSDEFRHYLRETTGYTEPDRRSFTDLCTLCPPCGEPQGICGVNLSVGYDNEHTSHEFLVIDAWLHTLNLARRWLSQSTLPTFRLDR